MTHVSNNRIAPVTAPSGEGLFDDLAADSLAQLQRQMRVAEYPAKHLFYTPAEQGDHVLFIQRGRVRLYKLSPEGRALTLFVLEPYAVFGEMALVDRQHDAFAEAMTDCTVGVLDRQQLRDVLRAHPAVALRFMGVMSERLRVLEGKLADIAFKSVPQRLAGVLLHFASHAAGTADDAPLAVVRYTHQQLAEMIGSYRETVTKAIGEFREDGLIRVDEDVIYLTNAVRLRAIADGQA